MKDDALMPSILIVEDSATNIKILVDTLKNDYVIGVVTNGPEAIEYAQEHIPDVILLDIIMPEMDGYEVCKILKDDETTQHIPIIFISALHEIENKAKGFKLGAVDYITKPFEVIEVVARVRNHVEFKQARQALVKKNQQLNKLSSNLSKYVPHQIYKSIFSSEKEVTVETHRKKLTVFFSDIVEFTKLTDSLESETLTYLLNDYLNKMAEICRRNGGTLNKFIGDAILIFFGDPDTKGDKEDALACVKMAIEMRDHMEILREKWHDQGIQKPPHIRMGISTGFCTVGNFGSEDRLEYTIIGGQVNLASRLENHALPDEIWISNQTYSLIKNEVVCGKRDTIKVKGIAYPVEAFELVELDDGRNYQLSRTLRNVEKYFDTLDLKRLNQENKHRLKTVLKRAIQKVSTLEE